VSSLRGALIANFGRRERRSILGLDLADAGWRIGWRVRSTCLLWLGMIGTAAASPELHDRFFISRSMIGIKANPAHSSVGCSIHELTVPNFSRCDPACGAVIPP
jgi:hypothetical protein